MGAITSGPTYGTRFSEENPPAVDQTITPEGIQFYTRALESKLLQLHRVSQDRHPDGAPKELHTFKALSDQVLADLAELAVLYTRVLLAGTDQTPTRLLPLSEGEQHYPVANPQPAPGYTWANPVIANLDDFVTAYFG